MALESKGEASSIALCDEPAHMQAEIEYRQALSRVMRLLARREYSQQEIRRKLGTDYSAVLVAAVIHRCLELDWLNETRMMAVFIRSRANRGYGPVRIMQELRLKGLAAEQIKLAMEVCENDWFALAKEQAERRASDPSALDRIARGRLLAYLQRRGFSSEQARYAMMPSDEE